MNPLKHSDLWNVFRNKQYYQPLSWPMDDSDDWATMPPELAGIFLEFMQQFGTGKPNLQLDMSLEDANNLILDAYRRGQALGW